MRIGNQIAEGIRYHQGLNAQEARTAAIEMANDSEFGLVASVVDRHCPRPGAETGIDSARRTDLGA